MTAPIHRPGTILSPTLAAALQRSRSSSSATRCSSPSRSRAPNGFDVAVSRARCLSILVLSPKLLDLAAGSIEEMGLASLVCRAEACAHDGAIPINKTKSS